MNLVNDIRATEDDYKHVNCIIEIPKGTNTKCTEALIYNYKLNNWTIRDLDNIVSFS